MFQKVGEICQYFHYRDQPNVPRIIYLIPYLNPIIKTNKEGLLVYVQNVKTFIFITDI